MANSMPCPIPAHPRSSLVVPIGQQQNSMSLGGCLPVDDDPLLTANSDSRVASQKATKSYVDALDLRLTESDATLLDLIETIQQVLQSDNPALDTLQELVDAIETLQNSELPIDIDPLLAANSDELIASQRAVKSYVDTAIGLINQTLASDDPNLDTVQEIVTFIKALALNKQNRTTIGLTAPAAPENGDLWFDTTTTRLKVYDLATTSWLAGSGGGASVEIDVSPPAITADGQIWYDPTTELLYVSYNGVWLPAGSPGVEISDTAPVGVQVGVLWYRPADGILAIQHAEGVWVETSGSALYGTVTNPGTVQGRPPDSAGCAWLYANLTGLRTDLSIVAKTAGTGGNSITFQITNSGVVGSPTAVYTSTSVHVTIGSTTTSQEIIDLVNAATASPVLLYPYGWTAAGSTPASYGPTALTAGVDGDPGRVGLYWVTTDKTTYVCVQEMPAVWELLSKTLKVVETTTTDASLTVTLPSKQDVLYYLTLGSGVTTPNLQISRQVNGGNLMAGQQVSVMSDVELPIYTFAFCTSDLVLGVVTNQLLANTLYSWVCLNTNKGRPTWLML